MRETWLNENQRLVSQDNFGNDIAAVEAATKKHEAIETDIMVSMFVRLKLHSLFRPCNDHAQILCVEFEYKAKHFTEHDDKNGNFSTTERFFMLCQIRQTLSQGLDQKFESRIGRDKI